MIKIAIHGAPRSGTTWLANIFNSNEKVAYRQQPLFSYAFKGFLDETSSAEKIREFFDGIYYSDDEYLHQVQEAKDNKVPTFKKTDTTHLVYKEVRYHYILDNLLSNSDVHIVGIIRNPFSVLSSFFKAPSEFKDGWIMDEEWLYAPKKNQGLRESYFGYAKWKEVAELFHNLNAKYGEERVTIINYSDLLLDTFKLTEYLFRKVELDLNTETYDFIRKSRSYTDSNAYSVFKAKSIDDDWKIFLKKSIIQEIQKDLSKTPLEKYLLV